MRTKNLPLIKEAPLIAVGFVVATAATLAAATLLKGTRLALRLTGLDRPAARTPIGH